MNKNKVSFSQMFSRSISNFSEVFGLFEASLFKVIMYFILLNLLMFLPITMQVVNLENLDYAKYGFTFMEDLPDWLPSGLPTHCKIDNNELQCLNNDVFEYDIVNRDKIYHIYFNVEDSVEIKESNTIIFYQSGINLNIGESNVLRLTYSGFGYTDFNEINQMSPEEASDILFESLFQSVKPAIILPIILAFVGILTLTNIILIFSIATLSMLFKFNQSDFPRYQDIIKLMIFASTIPSIINLGLGFFGLSAFTSISYNIITPILAYFMYKASRMKIEANL
jgi:maltodextrin utilization protein YvdJ